jgi:hypothetical protein
MTLVDAGISDTALSALSAILNFFYFVLKLTFDFFVQLATWGYNVLQFIWRNFRWDNPFHLLVLSMLLLLDIFAFLVMFGGSAAYSAGGFNDAYIGSGSVMSGLGPGDYGSIYGQGSSGNGTTGTTQNGTTGTTQNGTTGTTQPSDPDLCGNGFCDTFATRAKVFTLPSPGIFPGCSDTLMVYDIPTYCVSSGVKTYVWHQWSGDVVFNSAVCGLQNFYSLASPRCDYDNGSIWYVETPVNCVQDCNRTSCEIDLTCRDNPNNCEDQCCPAGTFGAYRCVDAGNIEGLCNNPDIIYEPLERLRRTSYHCPCSGNSSCISDYGGSTCCPLGTYHFGFCYQDVTCNSTG